MIKLANNINLSRSGIGVVVLSLVLVLAVGSSHLLFLSAAQVPPRSEAAQEQREEKSPLFTDMDVLGMSVQSTAFIRFSWEPLSIEFVADDGKTSKILFTEDGVTYSGDVSFDDSAKMFFDLFWKEYVLKENLKAKCKAVVGQREE